MHRCLTIVEVQRAVFHEVHQQQEDLATLARLARTCRVFNGVALDILWETVDSFVDLIRCLPRDLWKIEPENINGKVTFQRRMLPSDWEIIFRYSSRIRTLRWSAGRAPVWAQVPSLDDGVISALSSPPIDGPLIPHLKILSWDRPNVKHVSLVRSLLTPSLVSFELDLRGMTRSPEVSILRSIGTICPSLKNLSIPSLGPHSVILDAKGEKILSETLLNLHSLETLACPRLDEVAIVHICHLPSLADLSLQLRRNFQLDKVLPHVVPPAFASINKLALQTSDLSTLTSLLERMRFKPVSVSFSVTDTPAADALRLFLVTLATACGSEQLLQVSFTMFGERDNEQVSLLTFQPLLLLPSIQDFEFDGPFDLALDDDAITTLTKCWPKLTRLSLNADSGWGITSRVTHHGLIILLSRCPALTMLALAIDFSDIDMAHDQVPNSRPGNGVTNERCLTVDFVTSTIQYPALIAAFLSDICPKVTAIHSAWGSEMLDMDMDDDEVDTYLERWEEVGSLMPVFTAVRRQCMDWAQRMRMVENVTPA